eukprot:3417468-Rhodomonas_salina.2
MPALCAYAYQIASPVQICLYQRSDVRVCCYQAPCLSSRTLLSSTSSSTCTSRYPEIRDSSPGIKDNSPRNPDSNPEIKEQPLKSKTVLVQSARKFQCLAFDFAVARDARYCYSACYAISSTDLAGHVLNCPTLACDTWSCFLLYRPNVSRTVCSYGSTCDPGTEAAYGVCTRLTRTATMRCSRSGRTRG